MGAEAYTWVTKYRKNLAEALRTAREETFAAGKFIGVDEHPATMEEAVELGAEAGTGSILDITGVSECPELCSVCPLTSEELIEFFGTERPTFAQIEQCAPFWESFDRGEARAVTLYKNGKPSQICFAGWTIDAPAAGSGSFEEAKGKKKCVSSKSKTEFGLLVNLSENAGKRHFAFTKMSYDIMDLWYTPLQQIFQNGLYGFTETPAKVKCKELLAALKKLLEISVRGFYQYTVAEKGMPGGAREINIPLLGDPQDLRSAMFQGGACCCWLTLRHLEKTSVGYKNTREEVRDISDQTEMQMEGKTILIKKKKISPCFDRERLVALVSDLSTFDANADIQIMLGDIQFMDGEPVFPISEQEVFVSNSAITPEERAADLAFFKTFIDEYEQAFAAGNIKDFSESQKQVVSIFTKYQNDMEFLQSILSIRPDIVAKALAGGSIHGNP